MADGDAGVARIMKTVDIRRGDNAFRLGDIHRQIT
jgi:hypothetical protein